MTTYIYGKGYPSVKNILNAIEQEAKGCGIAPLDLEIVGGGVMDDTRIDRVTLINTDGSDWHSYGGTVAGIFLG